MTLAFNTWVEVDGCEAMPTSLLNNMESLVPISVNALPPVSFQPGGGLFMLIVNGVTFTPDDGSFSVSGQTITWLSTIFSIRPGDIVVAVYSYMG